MGWESRCSNDRPPYTATPRYMVKFAVAIIFYWALANKHI